MNISEVIKKFEELKRRHGDIPVLYYDCDYDWGDRAFDLDEASIGYTARDKNTAKKYGFPLNKTKLKEDYTDSPVFEGEAAILIGF